MASLVCEWKLENFSASAIYTGENRLVRVRGQGVCHQNGFELGLVRVNPGINPVRHRVHLGLVERPPEVGPQVETPVEIDEVFEIEPHITEVGIRGLGVLRVLEPA